MIGHIIFSILSIFISIKILKSIEVREFYSGPWEPFDLKMWHVILIWIFSIIPVINVLFILSLIIFVILYIFNDYYRLKYTSLINKINNFLNKSV